MEHNHDQYFTEMGFNTRALHVGQSPDPIHGTVTTGLHLSTTYAQTSPGVPIGKFDYSRAGNPTRESLETQLASLEKAKFCQTYSSGLSAISAICHLLKPGDHLLVSDDLYGGTGRYFKAFGETHNGLTFTHAKMEDTENILKNLTEKTKMVYIETPTNPTLKTTDIKEACRIIREFKKDMIIVVDNTFLSPYNQTPLTLGADIVVESATKYLGGHSDIVMGIVATNCEILNERLFFYSKCVGAVPSPFDCYQMIRSLKTLGIRMERINSNALKVAQYLTTDPNIEQVHYAGLTTNKFHLVAKSQQKGFGGIVSIHVKGDLEKTKKFLIGLKVFTLAESLGAVESLANHPELMTHCGIAIEKRRELGIVENFVRLSCGIEDSDDLIADLKQALKNSC
jgi:cystathionine gamma-lyase